MGFDIPSLSKVVIDSDGSFPSVPLGDTMVWESSGFLMVGVQNEKSEFVEVSPSGDEGNAPFRAGVHFSGKVNRKAPGVEQSGGLFDQIQAKPP